MQMNMRQSKSSASALPAGYSKALVLAVCTLVLATVILYLPVRSYEFLTWDDDIFITENWYVHQGLSWDGLRWAFVDLYTDYWHPVTWLSHMLDAQVFGAWAGGYHLVNVVIHILAACALLGFLTYTTGKPWASILVAGLFALHPLHVESVAWIAERKDVLSGLFFFLTLWAYAHYARGPSLWRFAGVLALYALGLMSKPTLLTMPAVMLLLDYWPLGRFEVEGWRIRTAGGTSLRMLVAEKAIPAAMAAAVLVLIIIGQQKTAMQSLATTGVVQRLTNAACAYGTYIANMFWPTGLAAFYPLSHVPHYGQAIVAGAAIAAITVIVFLVGKRFRFMVTGWFWYLLMLLPVIGIVQVGDQSHADRYTYLPLTGLFVIVAWLLLEVWQEKAAYRKAIIVLSLIALGSLWTAAYRYLPYWKDTESLCRRAIAVTEENYVMETDLAVWLATNGRYDEAEKLGWESYRIRSQNAATLSLMGSLALKKGAYEDAFGWFQRGLAVSPDTKELLFNAGSSLMSLGKAEESVPYFRRATQVDRHFKEAYYYLGAALITTGHVSEAAAAFQESFVLPRGIASDDMPGVLDRNSLCADMGQSAGRFAAEGRFTQAENYLRLCMELDPQMLQSYYSLARLLDSQGRKDEAAEVLQAAQRASTNGRAKDGSH